MKNSIDCPKVLVQPKQNSTGFIIYNGVTYFFNKAFNLYMRKDVVGKYRKLRKKHSSAYSFVNTVMI